MSKVARPNVTPVGRSRAGLCSFGVVAMSSGDIGRVRGGGGMTQGFAGDGAFAGVCLPPRSAGLAADLREACAVARHSPVAVESVLQPEGGYGMEWTVAIGVDTHRGSHLAVALDRLGRELDQRSVLASEHGYGELLAWAESFGRCCFAIEG